MPTINETPADKDRSVSSFDTGRESPRVTCGVQRKINIGNFESIDVYCSASIPVEIVNLGDKEEVESKLIQAMEDMIAITSKETADKYNLIKGN